MIDTIRIVTKADVLQAARKRWPNDDIRITEYDCQDRNSGDLVHRFAIAKRTAPQWSVTVCNAPTLAELLAKIKGET